MAIGNLFIRGGATPTLVDDVRPTSENPLSSSASVARSCRGGVCRKRTPRGARAIMPVRAGGGNLPSSSDRIAVWTCGHGDARGLAISKCPTPGMTTRRTGIAGPCWGPRVCPHQPQRHVILVLAPHEHLRDPEGKQLVGGGVYVALGYLGRSAAEQGGDDDVAAQGLVSLGRKRTRTAACSSFSGRIVTAALVIAAWIPGFLR